MEEEAVLRLHSAGNLATAVAAASISLPVEAPDPLPERHINVQCDECGEDPIVGIRYKSTTRRNYDVCEQCLHENHGGMVEGNFVAFEQRVSIVETRPLEPNAGGRSITAYSVANLAIQLDQDETIEDVTLYIGQLMRNASLNSRSPAAAREALAKHTGLKCLHIYIRGESTTVDETIVALAEGLKVNNSVISASWSIGASTRRHCLSNEACQALRELMEMNKTIRFMFVKRPVAFGNSRLELTEDNLCNYLFDGLVHSSLQTFRFVDSRPLKDNIKKKAWFAMETNKHIRRIEANFENNDCQLEILTADKKHHWMGRWAEPGAASQERLSVLEEVQHSQLDAVPALYHFIRNQPGFIIENQILFARADLCSIHNMRNP